MDKKGNIKRLVALGVLVLLASTIFVAGASSARETGFSKIISGFWDNIRPLITGKAISIVPILEFNSDDALLQTQATFNDCSASFSDNTEYFLTQDINSSSSCLSIGGQNITVDCQGFTINFSQETSAPGVFFFGVNSTLRNCNIVQGNTSLANFGTNGVQASSVANFTLILNNTFTSFGSPAIHLSSVNTTTIIGNTITVYQPESSSGGSAIHISNGASHNNVLNNNITTFLNASNGIGVFVPGAGNLVANNTVRNLAPNSAGSFAAGINFGGYRNNATGNVILTIGERTRGINLNQANSSFIDGNFVNTTNGNNSIGIFMTNSSHIVVNNNTVFTTGSAATTTDGSSNAIGTSAASGVPTATCFFVNITNNVAVTTGYRATALFAANGGQFILFDSNNATTYGNNSNGINLGNATNATVIRNFIVTNGAENSSGIGSTNSTNSLIANNTISSKSSYMNIAASFTGTRVSNLTFFNSNGSVALFQGGEFVLSNSGRLTIYQLNISSNRVYLNSTGFPDFNRSAIIRLNGLSLTSPQAIVDFNDDGTFETCSAPQCSNLSYSGGTFVFNVSSFTTYSTQESSGTSVSACGSLSSANTVYSLTQNVTTGSTCFTVGADSVTLNCNGFTISGTGAASSYGVSSSSGFDGATIKNCVISTFNTGISFQSGNNNNTVTNSTIFNNGLSAGNGWGIELRGSSNNTVTGNTIYNNYQSGVLIQDFARNNRVINNTVFNHTQGYAAIDLAADAFFNLVANNTIANNTEGVKIYNCCGASAGNSNIIDGNIISSSTSHGIELSDGTGNNTISNNVVSNVSQGIRIVLSSNANRVLNNTVNSSTEGIFLLVSAHTNLISGNSINHVGRGMAFSMNSSNNSVIGNVIFDSIGEGIKFDYGNQNNTLVNNWINLQSQSTGVYIISDGNQSSGNNMTNTTFFTSGGRVRFIDTISLPSTEFSINANDSIKINSHRVLVNSTKYSFLNKSAEINLFGFSDNQNRTFVDFNDDRSFEQCNSPQCTNASSIISIGPTYFRFFVASFTTYSWTGGLNNPGNSTVILNRTNSSITLSWPHNGNNPDGTFYSIQYTNRTDLNCSFNPDPFTGGNSSTTNVSVLTNLLPNTYYWIDVCNLAADEDSETVCNANIVTHTLEANNSGTEFDITNDCADEEEETPTPSTSSGGGGGGRSRVIIRNETNATAVVETPVSCQPNWQCGDWSACTDGKQLRSCSDFNSCGVSSGMPMETQSCTSIPSPAPEAPKSNLALAVAGITALTVFLALGLASGMIAIQRIRVNKKLRSSMRQIYGSLALGDRASAAKEYNQFRGEFAKYYKNLSKKNADKIYYEGMKLHEKLSK